MQSSFFIGKCVLLSVCEVVIMGYKVSVEVFDNDIRSIKFRRGMNIKLLE